MKSLRNKLYILSYLGNVLMLIATFVPIIKFNNQSFAFIDQFFFSSFVVVIMVTASLVLITMRKYKLSLIPTIINISIIAFGIYKIFTIEGLNLTENLSYGIALILYPIAAIMIIVGNLLTTKKETNKKIKAQTKEPINDTPIQKINEPQEATINNVIQSFNSEEQIPLEQIINKENLNQNKEISIDNQNNITSGEILENNGIKDENNLDDIDILEDISDYTEIKTEEVKDEINNIEVNEFPSFDEDQIIENISNDDEDFFEEIYDDEPNNDNVLSEIVEENNELPSEDTYLKNENLEIPDISINDENIMLNNTQIEDKPKPEFMAINPGDIKIQEKKPLFKKKEKPEEDPLAKIMKRNVPMTLGRTCQFCNTPLGDDERICPLCGRIN